MEEALQIHPDFDCRPARVYFFGDMSFYPTENTQDLSSRVKLVLARVSWYYPHTNPHTNRYMLGKPVQVWCPMFEDHFVYNFVPVHLFVSRCSYCTKIINDQSLFY